MKVRLSMAGVVVEEERLETWGLRGGRERVDMSSVSLSSWSLREGWERGEETLSLSDALVGSTAPHPAGESGWKDSLAILLVQGGGVETLWGEGEAIVAQL